MNKKEIKTYATAAIIIALICVVYKMYFPQEGMKVNGKTIQGMKDLDSLKGMKDLDSLKGMKDLDSCAKAVIAVHCNEDNRGKRFRARQAKRKMPSKDHCTKREIKRRECV
tara:strand:- start:123 stop:455 length:333 start_codon:yes stop_codon:yes gene_type:complete